MSIPALHSFSGAEPAEAYSEEDLALLHALQIAPRAAWTELADVLDAHPATLARRWARMRSRGLAWVTAHQRGDPAAMVVAFVDVDCELGRREEAVAALARLPEVQTIDIGSSHPDIALTVFAASILDYAESVVPRIAAQPGVLRMDAHLCTRLHAGGHTWRLAALNRAQIAAVSELARVEQAAGRLPAAALELLPHLALDGRATAAELARALGRSTATVHRQLTRVIGSGMLAFRCEVAQTRAGYPVACKWLANVPPGQHAAAAAALSGLRSIRLAASTTGRTNFTIMMWLRSVADVLTGELTLREKVPGIVLVESVVMIRAVKRVGVMLRPDGTATGVVVPVPDLGS